MANTEMERYYVYNDDVFLIDSDSIVHTQQSTSIKKDEKNATKSSREFPNVTDRSQDGPTPTTQGGHVGARHERGYTNSLCPDQDRNGSDWQGGFFTPSASTPRPDSMETAHVKHIPDYLALSIVTTIVFFFPIAVFAIIYSMKARALKRSGHYTKAADTATQALHLNILSIVMGVICYATTGFLVWYNIKHMEKLAHP